MKTGELMHDDTGKDEGTIFFDVPQCRECSSRSGVKPSFHSYKGAYFCIECCNYLDNRGVIQLD